MIKIKLINIMGCETCKQVLLYTDIDSRSRYTVKLLAWHSQEDQSLIQQSKVEFEEFNNTELACSRFICDFSESSANEFANSMVF